MRSCESIFPFSGTCNGHGSCVGDGLCNCLSDYIGDYIDIFTDPHTVQCFISRISLWWFFVAMLLMTSATVFRVLLILARWIKSGLINRFTIYQFFDEIIRRPSLQCAFCKLGAGLLVICIALLKLLMSDISPIGITLATTNLYGLTWILTFADCLIALNLKLSAVPSSELGSTGASAAVLSFVKRLLWPMFFISLLCFR